MAEEDAVLNEIEYLIHAGKEGNITVTTLFQVLLRAPIWLLLNKDVESNVDTNDIQALVLQAEEDEPLIALFTKAEHAKRVIDKNPAYSHPQLIPAARILDNLDSQVGLVINPGMDLSIQIYAQGVVELKKQLGHGFLKNIPVDTEGSEPDSGNEA